MPAFLSDHVLQVPQTGLLADAASNATINFSRLAEFTEWWHWVLLLFASVAIVGLIGMMYVLDSRELSSGATVLLLSLRVFALLGLLLFFLDLEKRTEHRLVKDSRVVVMLDNSLSMGLRDTESLDSKGAASRSEELARSIADGPMLAELRQTHHVVAYRFGEDAKPEEIGSFPKLTNEQVKAEQSEVGQLLARLDQSRFIGQLAGGLLLVSLLSGFVYWILRWTSASKTASLAAAGVLWTAFLAVSIAALVLTPEFQMESLANFTPGRIAVLVLGLTPFIAVAIALAVTIRSQSAADLHSWIAVCGVWSLLACGVTLAVAHLRVPELAPQEIVGIEDASQALDKAKKIDDSEEKAEDPADSIEWMTELRPRGAQTRLGDSLRYLVNRERGGPIAGIVLLTDGGQNSGVAPDVAVRAAQDAKIPVYAVGLGSDKLPINVSVVDLQAPPRVYPGDEYAVVGLLRASGLKGRRVRVELYVSQDDGPEVLEEERTQVLETDGKTVSLRFEMPPKEGGRYAYTLKVVPPDGDHDNRDNAKSAKVEVVERRNKVLVLAGGPTREFRFLRNQLYRDRDTEVHVILQTGQPGISQEADELLFEFPSHPDELFQYDCVIAFDPDWRLLTEDQVRLLERWVAEKAGGLIVVAGPVYTPLWTGQRRGDRRFDILKGLYPVVFYQQGAATIRLGRFGGEEPWKLDFTPEGRRAEFLWLEDNAIDSEASWDSFEGVYGYYAVREAKKGGQIYAHFSDPDTMIDDQLPIYLAGQFYGAGRVFFQASGEMWRIRAIDDRAFEQYYTKLIRWASQGRLLRDSSRGVLLVDQDRCILGEQVAVTAILQDAQHRPLTDSEVTAVLIQPDGTHSPLRMPMLRDAAREGAYAAGFTASQEGDYRVEIKVPGELDEVLSAEVRARAPDLEVEKPQRNDVLLQQLTDETEGRYYVGLAAAMKPAPGNPAVFEIASAEKTSFVPAATPDRSYSRVLRWWLLMLICVSLCLEWTVRRISRLA
ncbi:vWA domain-containing protein [Lignipirellula cremea]|uniref:von Willebrand factor type A domain protein n=1 Tax=Lignipirellula cremea TaxID=2528010 RepID=A0A518DMS9_9BACT|nr:VWA domain-containing protein [Lignipirellula cremea]QDU93146.1 hypothetical protein Pla8534_09250 [Lignipirellula cremea]